jgi:hypothetical protein
MIPALGRLRRKIDVSLRSTWTTENYQNGGEGVGGGKGRGGGGGGRRRRRRRRR